MGVIFALIHIPLGIALAVGSAIAAGLFGLQYTTMRRYTVSNASFLSVIVATIIVPPIFVSIMCPGWPQALQEAGLFPSYLKLDAAPAEPPTPPAAGDFLTPIDKLILHDD